MLFFSHFFICADKVGAQSIFQQRFPLAEAIPRSHAHNDYEKMRPALYSALSHGFISVEIDIFYREKSQKDGKKAKAELIVSHIPLFLGWKPRLESLYFRRIDKWLAEYGQFYQDSNQRLTLMIDVKNRPNETYQLLSEIIAPYRELITHRNSKTGELFYRKIDILLSGAKPYETVKNDSIQYLFLDGGFGNIGDAVYTQDLCPRVSSSYRSHFKNRGKFRPISEADKTKAKLLADKAHQDNRQIRFWAMPDNRRVWYWHWQAGTDWLNVDKIRKFNRYYHKKLKKNAAN